MADAYRDEGREQGWREGLAKGLAEGRTEGLVEGQARGRAEGVLRILAARGIAVDEGTRQRILSCTDLNTLDKWFDKALNATSLSDVL
jgi:flagellar biosynthesis/type III secretory pathway protein FliH